ncbi:MAG: L-threonylcarbamoyladenylate synthase [Chitinophagaceae bacterium]
MNEFQLDITKCIEVLQNGGIIVYPTDTMWALGCDATNVEAVEKLYVLLNRKQEDVFTVLVADERTVLAYATEVDLAVFDAIASLQKPTTVIYKGVIGLAENLLYSDGAAAIRICNDTFCKHLIKRFQKPIVAAIASFSDTLLPNHFSKISSSIINKVDYVVKYQQAITLTNELASIVVFEKDGTLNFISN